jgi:hypothetical protein
LLVSATLLEAVLIAQHLLENDSWKHKLPELKRKLREQADRIDALGGIDKGEATSSPYLKSKTPCVFLKENGDCGIYRIRPLSCRTYFVASPPSYCDPDDPESVVAGFDMRVEIFNGWAACFAEKDVPPLADSLQRMVLVAFEFLERKPASFREWLSHQPQCDLPNVTSIEDIINQLEPKELP